MNKPMSFVLATLLVGALGFALMPVTRAQSLAGVPDSTMIAEGYGPGHMMGPGMTGGGMMGQPNGDQETPASPVNSVQANALVNYIHDQGLTCFQCHEITGGGLVPSFDTVSAHYAGRKNAISILERNIVFGVGEMPENLASDQQAARLSRLILNLGNPGTEQPEK